MYEPSLHDWAGEAQDARADALDERVDDRMDSIRHAHDAAGATAMEEAISDLYDSVMLSDAFHKALFDLWRSPKKREVEALRGILHRALEAAALKSGADAAQ